MSVTVRPRGVVYVDGDTPTSCMGVEVISTDGGSVSAVGWEVTGPSGGARLVILGRPPHPHRRLPHRMKPGESASWMMTPSEVRAALRNNEFRIEIDAETARFRPYVTIDGKTYESDEDTGFIAEGSL